MKYVTITNSECMRPLPFYLAMEEWLADAMERGAVDASDDYLFMWRVAPTVIVGRNQTLDLEVDVDYCRREGIDVCRRRSGGGTVFADPNNIMISYVTAQADALAVTFRRYTRAIVAMLRELGLDASDSSRNDVLISGRKVSGNAFYHRGVCSIVHGTMLFDTDMKHMGAAITPSRSKLTSHRGVESVAGRITLLNEHVAMNLEEFMTYARDFLTDGELLLDDDVCSEIEERMEAYRRDEWLYRNVSKGWLERCDRIADVGEVTALVKIDGEHRIHGLDFRGDFFQLAEVEDVLMPRLRNVEFDAEAVARALEEVDPGNVIYGLTKEELINLLF